MPTTYTPLATTTLSSNAGTVTLSGISGSYTDLVLVMNIIGNAAQEIYFRVNGDTGSNYSGTRLSGNGTTATSARASNQSVGFISGIATTSTTNPSFNSITHFQNYSNTTAFKTVLSRASNVNSGVDAFVSLWRNTAAITSIEISSSTSSFASGSTFSLYGIASAAVVSGAKATGGDTIATDGTYWYHAFRTSGTFTPTQALTCDVLVVAGGGSGGWPYSGGGGAGGVIAFSAQSLSTAQTVTVGAGGAGAYNTGNGQLGSNSVFGSLTAAVGGGGGVGDTAGAGNVRRDGGSGGGGAAISRNPSFNAGGTGVSGQGNAGGSGSPSSYTNEGGGGGGGAGAVGSNATGTNSGNGGAGTNSVTNWGALSGVLTTTGLGVNGFIAGGGGGGTNGVAANAGNGGSGGGGRGASNDGTRESEAGTINTGSGSGGGGAGGAPASPKNGGSGIIIVRYPV